MIAGPGMMVQAMASAVSGLLAATTAVGVAAANLANAHSADSVPARAGSAYQGYVPLRAAAVSLADGGVAAVVREADPAFVGVYDPGHPAADAARIVRLPNVSPEAELVNLRLAHNAYSANLAVLRTVAEMLGRALDRRV